VSSALAVRICNEHGKPCTEDARDRVVCPAGHVVREGKWSVVGSALAGDELVVAEARRAFREQKRDHDSAREALLAAARLNPRLARALLEDAAGRAIARAAGIHVAVPVPAATTAPARHVAAPSSKPARSTTDNGLALMARSNLRDLLAQELTPGGIQLGDANRQAVLEEAISSGGQARRGAIRARWLRLIAGRVPMGRRVAQVLREEDVQRLHHQAEADLDRVLAGLDKRLTTSRGRHLEAAK
jgi:hypothetical protein